MTVGNRAAERLMQIGEAWETVGIEGVLQFGGLMTNTLSPGVTGNCHRPSASVLTTSRPFETRTLARP